MGSVFRLIDDQERRYDTAKENATTFYATSRTIPAAIGRAESTARLALRTARKQGEATSLPALERAINAYVKAVDDHT